MTPLAYSQHLQASIANARLEVIPGGSHMLMLEQPDLFNAILKRMCECAYAPVR
jgi:pimeloyl-ACP methyl ester carboxylesterase